MSKGRTAVVMEGWGVGGGGGDGAARICEIQVRGDLKTFHPYFPCTVSTPELSLPLLCHDLDHCIQNVLWVTCTASFHLAVAAKILTICIFFLSHP